MIQIQKSFEKDIPTLYIVATPIGNLQEMTPRAIEVLKQVDIIAAEDTRTTAKLLSHFQIKTKMIAHHKHNEQKSAQGIVKLLEEGKSVALVSDAGYPLLSDPGEVLRNHIIEKGFPIVPISGCNAMLNALVASGICVQPFLFYGFLAQTEKEREKQLQQLKEYSTTLIFYEAPHRMHKMLTSLLTILGNRHICLAKELTKKHETFIRGTVQEILTEIEEFKGEYVVVVEPSKESYEIHLEDLLQEVENQIQIGLSSKDAIKLVSKKYNYSKNELYQSYMKK